MTKLKILFLNIFCIQENIAALHLNVQNKTMANCKSKSHLNHDEKERRKYCDNFQWSIQFVF